MDDTKDMTNRAIDLQAQASPQGGSKTEATEPNNISDTTMGNGHKIIHQSIKEKSFVDHLKFIVELKSDLVFSTWYDEKGKAVNNYTFQQIWDEAGQCAHLLRNKWGVNKGDRVVLCYDFGLHFFAVFLGCLRAGVTAVLVYPPGPPLVKSLAKMNKVVEDCSPALILTQTTISMLRAADRANPVSKSRAMWPSGVKFQVTDRIIYHDAFAGHENSAKRPRRSFLSRAISSRSWASSSTMTMKSFDEPNIEGSDIAFLQYTSGSTGNPKGVMVTHDALRANIELLHSGWLECLEHDLGDMSKLPERITTFSWLPQYHDLGLIQLTIAPLAGAFRAHMMSPVSFIRNPLLWMDLISKHKCHFTVAPDFGYRLVTRKFNEAKARGGDRSDPIPDLDLSSMFRFQNAAEPIRLDTTELFSAAFSPHCLRKEWFMAGYGLAENVVGVSYQQGFQVSSIREDEDLHPFVAIAHRDTLHYSVDIIIVHPETREPVPDNSTGEMWIAGPSMAAGYYNQPGLTSETFRAVLLQGDPAGDTATSSGSSTDRNTSKSSSSDNSGAPAKTYLRTGDYGFYQDDYLYICGRKKDVIIVNGVNYYPQDIEHAVEEASPAVRPGCVAAFSSDESGNDGRLEIVFEIRSSHAKEAAAVCNEIKRAVMEEIGLTPATVTAVEERTISKTTSGKIQRRRNRERLHDGTQKMVLDVIGTSNFFSVRDGDLASQSKRLSLRKSCIQDLDIKDMDFNEIVKDVTGSQVKTEDKWKDVGLSSMMELELRQSLARRYNTVIPPNCFEMFPSVLDLKTYLEASIGQPLPTNLPTLKRIQTVRNEKSLSQPTIAFIQAIGALAVLFIFALPIIPAFEIGRVLVNDNRTHVLFFIDFSPYLWVWYPLVIPFWSLTLTIEVVLAKWIVIGRYREGRIHQTSIYFLRWWFVDRLMHLWELFVGRFVLGTPLMTVFCYLMGANVHRSSRIDSCIREFDLVTMGAHAKATQAIRCRMFGAWEDGVLGPSMRFRKIQIGANATVNGTLCPGAKVGSSCHVCNLAVLVEGAQAPPNTVIKGNPGFIDVNVPVTDPRNSDDNPQGEDGGTIDAAGPSNDSQWIALGAMKIIWLLIELYFAFTCFLTIDILVRDELPIWRYSKLQYWIVLFGLTSSFLLVSSILFKWVLIGKKRPGKASTSVISQFADWACDFHFTLGCFILYGLTFNSIIWNLILMALGMDIDLTSKVFAEKFFPSKVDLVSVRRSFISVFDPHVKDGNEYAKITVEDSSIGIMTVAEPGVEIRNSVVPPQTHITENVVRSERHPRNMPLSLCEHVILMATNTLLYGIMLVVVAGSFIPAYELWMRLIKPQTPSDAVPAVVACIIVQSAVWTVLLRILECITFLGTDKRTTPWCLALYMVYQSFCWSVSVWSFTWVLSGTPMMNGVLRFQGIKVEGRLLYFACRAYEPTHITIADGCVIDESVISGHHDTFAHLTLVRSYVSGVLHQKCGVMGAVREPVLDDAARLMEHGPQHLLVGVGDGITDVAPTAQSDEVLPSHLA